MSFDSDSGFAGGKLRSRNTPSAAQSLNAMQRHLSELAYRRAITEVAEGIWNGHTPWRSPSPAGEGAEPSRLLSAATG